MYVWTSVAQWDEIKNKGTKILARYPSEIATWCLRQSCLSFHEEKHSVNGVVPTFPARAALFLTQKLIKREG